MAYLLSPIHVYWTHQPDTKEPDMTVFLIIVFVVVLIATAMGAVYVFASFLYGDAINGMTNTKASVMVMCGLLALGAIFAIESLAFMALGV